MSIPGSATPLLLATTAAAGPPAAFQIDRSLRFNSADSAYLNRTPSSAGNRRTWTWSGWIKLSKVPSAQGAFFNAKTGSGNANTGIDYDSSGPIRFIIWNGSSTDANLTPTRVFRDFSAWYHLVVAFDSTQATASDRVKMYINGSQITDFSTSQYPSQNYEAAVNLAQDHYIGRNAGNGVAYLDSYLAEINFVDGQALAPTDFGKYDDNNVWQPKEPSFTSPNNGTTWSDTSNMSGASLAFDGLIGATGGIFTSSGSTLTTSSITINSTLEIYHNRTQTAGVDVTINGTTYNAPGSGSNGWHTVPITGPITTSGAITITDKGGSSSYLYAVRVDGVILVDGAGKYGTNGFHLDFSDNSSNAALGYDAAGSNDWTVNNLVGDATYGGSATVWTSGDTNWVIASGGGSATMSAGGYWDVFSGLLQTDNVYAFTTSWTNGDTNGGWFFSDSNSTSLSGTHPNEGRGSNSIGQRGGTAALGTKGTFSSANSVTDGSASISGFTDTNPAGSDSLTWVVDRNNHKVWVSHDAGSSWVKGGDPSNTSSTPSFYLPSTGDVYFGFNQNTQMTTPLTISALGGASTDSLIDTPTNYTAASGNNGGNYATLNPLDNGGLTLSDGNLTVSRATNSWRVCKASIGITSGKHYWEYTLATTTNSSNASLIGIVKSDAPISNNYVGETASGWAFYSADGRKVTSDSFSSYGSGMSNGDTIGVAFDADNGTLAFYQNGSSLGNAFTGLTSGPYFPAVSLYGTQTYHFNFGQRPFAYTPPTGYKSLCTTNLPDPTIADGSTAMDAKLWTGPGATRMSRCLIQTQSGLNP